MEKMLNLNSQKPSNLEEFKEKKIDVNKETDIIFDDVKKSKLNESNANVMRILQNLNTHTGK